MSVEGIVMRTCCLRREPSQSLGKGGRCRRSAGQLRSIVARVSPLQICMDPNKGVPQIDRDSSQKDGFVGFHVNLPGGRPQNGMKELVVQVQRKETFSRPSFAVGAPVPAILSGKAQAFAGS